MSGLDFQAAVVGNGARRAVLSMSAVIPSGKTALVTSRPNGIFRAERVVISPSSFPLSRRRAAWTWPLVAIGTRLGRVHRALAKLLRVDLYAPRERREYIQDSPDLDADDYDSLPQDSDGRIYREIPIPLTRRERILAPIGRAAARLGGVRVRWQQGQLSYLVIHDIVVGNRSQFAQAGNLPGDLFATSAIDNFVSFDTCKVGYDIAIKIENGSRRECQLVMALIGTEVRA